jgi:hypothetical protein
MKLFVFSFARELRADSESICVGIVAASREEAEMILVRKFPYLEGFFDDSSYCTFLEEIEGIPDTSGLIFCDDPFIKSDFDSKKGRR